MNNQQWSHTLDAVDQAYGVGDFERAGALLGATEARVPCLVEVAEPKLVSRFALQMSYRHSLVQDADQAVRWAQLGRFLDPDLSFPPHIPLDHAARAVLEDVEDPQMITLHDRGYAYPRGGGVFMNGSFAMFPSAPVEVPLLMQVFDDVGGVTEAYWQDGASFPESILGPRPTENPKPPEWYAKRSTDVRRQRFTIAAGLGAAAGGLYAAAWGTRLAYDGSPSDGLYYTVNGTVVASGAAGAAAVGFLTAALLTR